MELILKDNGAAILEGHREIPVAARADVIVCGGGVAGLAAAIAAARNGADTLLVERNSFIGGTATAAMMPVVGVGFSSLRGVAVGFFDRMVEMGVAGKGPLDLVPFDPESFKFIAVEMLQEAGVRPLFYSWVSEPLMDGDRLAGVVVENKSGRQALLGKVVIDTTGDADVAARAGAPFQKGRETDGKMRPVTLLFRVGNVDLRKIAEYVEANPDQFSRSPARKVVDMERNFIRVMGFYDLMTQGREAGEIDRNLHYLRIEGGNGEAGLVFINTTRVYGIDGTDAWDLSRSEVEARRQVWQLVAFLRKRVPGFDRACLVDVSNNMGVRETRHLLGEYVLTEADAADSRWFPDSLGLAYTNHTRGAAMHSPDGDEGSERDTKMRYLVEKAVAFHIPYRSLLPQKLDGLLVAGRCMSSSHNGDAWTRGMSTCMHTGQAAGTAAALAVRQGVAPRKVDIARLQETLASQGIGFGERPVEVPTPQVARDSR
ncbi:MAG: FAD-dependent oxidoreductase [Actinobacteria bacterium]|nr:FAD-dependent oxidoreductase [Actinomycetota bacterium]